MKYGSKSSDDKKKSTEKKSQIDRAKSDMTVKVIQYNHVIDEVASSINSAIAKAQKISVDFGNQRELLSRSRMTERVIGASLKMLSNNKLQLWMINDREIEEGLE